VPAVKWTAWLAIVLGAWILTGTPAAAQLAPVPDAEQTVSGAVGAATAVTTSVSTTQLVTVPDPVETVSDIVDTAGDTVDQAAETVQETASGATGGGTSTSGGGGGGAVSDVGGAVSGVSGTLSGGGTTSSGGTSSGSTSTSSGGSSASGSGSTAQQRRATPGRRYRSAFDRLPLRVETLLERIELGRNVRANLRRLERLLANASPALRARVLRLIRAEMRRLRAHGVTPAERRRLARLRLVHERLTADMSPAGAVRSGAAFPAAAAEAGFVLAPPASLAPPGNLDSARERPGRTGGEVLEVQAGGRGDAGPESRADALPLPPLPERPNEFPFPIGLIALALVALGFVGIVAAVTRQVVGRIRSG
jgi:hypothetical protein